jgi:type I restriction enzyme R subunit
MSNFAFLSQPQWAFLFESAKKAEELAKSDARGSCFYARRTLELAVAWLYKHERQLRLPYQDNLSALIHEPTFRHTVGDALFTKARVIKDLGNMAVHSTKKMVPSDALSAARELFHFSYWLARTYGRTGRPEPSLQFDLGLLPDATAVTIKTAASQGRAPVGIAGG